MVLTQVFSVGSARDPEKGGVGEGINGMPPCISIVQSYQYSLQYTQKRKMGGTPYTQKRKLKKKNKVRSVKGYHKLAFISTVFSSCIAFKYSRISSHLTARELSQEIRRLQVAPSLERDG